MMRTMQGSVLSIQTKLMKRFRAALIYITTGCLGFFAVSYLAFTCSSRFTPSPHGELYSKYLHITTQPDRYDLLFLGDSRAFCAVHPALIDQQLDTRSFNLAHWTNWLPTQYPLVRDLVHVIPPKTNVVLFIGHINFQHSEIYDKYPIGIASIAEYQNLGFRFQELWNNIASFNPLLRFYHKRSTVRSIFQSKLDQQCISFEPAFSPSPQSPTELDLTIQALRQNAHVAFVETIRSGAHVTSLAVHTTDGSYERIEIDESFFRKQQNESSQRVPAIPPAKPDARYLGLYKKILTAFKETSINLIIVELEEAPYLYDSAVTRESWRRHVRSFAQTEAHANGFPYITLPLELIQNEGYFDYDHMNSKGIRQFSPMLTNAIAPYLIREAKD